MWLVEGAIYLSRVAGITAFNWLQQTPSSLEKLEGKGD